MVILILPVATAHLCEYFICFLFFNTVFHTEKKPLTICSLGLILYCVVFAAYMIFSLSNGLTPQVSTTRIFKFFDSYKDFAAFAKLCVERQLYTAIETAGRMKNAPLNGYISLSEESEHLLDAGIEDALIERENYQQIYAIAGYSVNRQRIPQGTRGRRTASGGGRKDYYDYRA